MEKPFSDAALLTRDPRSPRHRESVALAEVLAAASWWCAVVLGGPSTYGIRCLSFNLAMAGAAEFRTRSVFAQGQML